MKKIMFPLVLLVVGITSNGQSAKKEPPPPPPQPKDEMVKYKPSEKIIVDEEVNASKPKEPPVVRVKDDIADDFYNRNPSVTAISRQGNIISLKKKDGTVEKFDMSKEEDKSFTEKYGVSPIPPPPPPKGVSRA